MDGGRHNGKVCLFLCLSRCDIQCVIWLLLESRLFLPAFVAAACVSPHVLLHLPLHSTNTFSCSRKSAVASVISSTLNIYKSKLSTWFFFVCLWILMIQKLSFQCSKNPLRWEKTSQEFNKIENTSIKKTSVLLHRIKNPSLFWGLATVLAHQRLHLRA